MDFSQSLFLQSKRLAIEWKSKSMDDAGALRWCQWASRAIPAFVHEKQLRKPAEDTLLAASIVDFSGNNIGDRGCHGILSLLFQLRIAADKLKLHKNLLGRAAAQTLMHFLGRTEHPLNELHLSHNYITREGAVDILKGVAWNPRYPGTLRDSVGRLKYVPLWLRLESNMISDAEGLLIQAERKMQDARRTVAEGHHVAVTSDKAICEISDIATGYCSATRCDHANGTHCAMVHLTYPRQQRLPLEKVKVPAEAKAWQDRPNEASLWTLGGPKAVPSRPPKSSTAEALNGAPPKKAVPAAPWAKAEAKKASATAAPTAPEEESPWDPMGDAGSEVDLQPSLGRSMLLVHVGPPGLQAPGHNVEPLSKRPPEAAPKHAWQTDIQHPPCKAPPILSEVSSEVQEPKAAVASAPGPKVVSKAPPKGPTPTLKCPPAKVHAVERSSEALVPPPWAKLPGSQEAVAAAQPKMKPPPPKPLHAGPSGQAPPPQPPPPQPKFEKADEEERPGWTRAECLLLPPMASSPGPELETLQDAEPSTRASSWAWDGSEPAAQLEERLRPSFRRPRPGPGIRAGAGTVRSLLHGGGRIFNEDPRLPRPAPAVRTLAEEAVVGGIEELFAEFRGTKEQFRKLVEVALERCAVTDSSNP
ncbi:unnamed protein product [Symbiodinium sp. CCMP2592]|nr:unnamed protein product [Symbiodinium sp. CCMP2592]